MTTEQTVQEFLDWARAEARARNIPLSSVNVSFWSFYRGEVRIGVMLNREPDADFIAPTIAEAIEKARAWFLAYKPREDQLAEILGLHLLAAE